MTQYGGMTNAEAMYDYDKTAEVWLAGTKKLNWDMAPPPFTIFPGPVWEKLGLKTFKWPGYNLKENLPYQFVEEEYMLADEYDEFLSNPSDFVIRKMMPRMATTLEPLGMLPPITLAVERLHADDDGRCHGRRAANRQHAETDHRSRRRDEQMECDAGQIGYGFGA